MSQKRKSTSAPDNRIAKRPTPEPSYDDPQPLQASTSSFQVSQNYFTNSQTQSHVNIPHDRYDRSAPPPEPSWIMPTSGPSGNSRNYIQRRLPVPKRTTASTAPSLSDPWLHTLVSSPQVPQVYGSQARQAYGSIRHDQEEEPTGSYHGLSRVAPTLHSSGDPRDSHSQQDIGGKFPHLNSIYRSRTPLSERSVSTISAQSFHDDLAMSPFPPSSPGSIETPRVTPSIYTLQDNNTRFRPQLEHRGTEFVSPPLSEPLLPSPTGPTGSRKKSVFGATRILLQTAASALKMSPVPALLANIPDLLLTLLQVFEVGMQFSQ
ncbi:uncharacterized protein EI90DRAFT_3071011, partial [Cantharellus anzutake]|uniref:uncharacterized protein n=1 Tax=Cantharellus anzutake TaxID=1750568 RepID=UPI001905AC74